jgi:hypothetical protein
MDLSIEIYSERRWSYAYAGTGRPVLREITLVPSGRLPERDIQIRPRVTFDFPLPEPVAEPWTAETTRTLQSRGVDAGKPITWSGAHVRLNYPVLGRLEEQVHGVIRVEIVDTESDEVLASASQELELLAPNEFRLDLRYMETIAAFVLPSDPFVAEILQSARRILEERTGDSSTQGYQAEVSPTEDGTPWMLEGSRAFRIAEAVYDAMRAVGYDYSNPPGYFGSAQRIRTPTQIKVEHCATCVDSTVLMAACLAQTGLEPVVFLVEGHAFAGYFTGRPFDFGAGVVSGGDVVRRWLAVMKRDGKCQLVAGDDRGLIDRLLGEQHILPIETTTTTAGGSAPFLAAHQNPNNFSVSDTSSLQSIVVVRLAREQGIKPPPRLGGAPTPFDGEESGIDDPFGVPLPEVPDAESSLVLDDAKLSPEERAIPPRVRQWMASLLDLSSRNPLLKMKLTGRTPAMMEFDVPASVLGVMDDRLHTPKKGIILTPFSKLPVKWIDSGVSEGDFAAWSKEGDRLVFPSYKELSQLDVVLQRYLKRIRTDPTHPLHKELRDESDAVVLEHFRNGELASSGSALDRAAKKLVDKSAAVMLMTGTNSLYLALGSISWTETSSYQGRAKATEWCAPLYLYPVVLEGGKGRPWRIALDPNGEVTPNYCLHEKLKRPPYNIDLQELVNPATDDHGLDFDAMMRQIARRLEAAGLTHLAVQPRAVLGVFDYATFRLWKDLRDDWQQMAAISPVFKHLAYEPTSAFTGNPPIPKPQLEPMLPIEADDSQREAVQLALDGQSFRLEGPPGTGKSQTITNLLASCIAHDVKVLFVAEKQTALNAVKDRLDKVGLGVFSLNLHAKGDSDAKIRRNIEASLTTVLQQKIDPADSQWKAITDALAKELTFLERYKTALHEPGPDDLSAWDANEQLLEVQKLLERRVAEAGDDPDEPGLPAHRLPIELSEAFVELYQERIRDTRDAVIALEGALDLIPNPLFHRWRLVGSVDLDVVDLRALTGAVQPLADAAGRLQALAGRVALDRVDLTRLWDAASVAVRLRQADLPFPAGGAPGVSSPEPDQYRPLVEQFLADLDALHGDLGPHDAVVSAGILERADRAEIARLVADARSPELRATLDAAGATWGEIAERCVVLPSPEGFRPLDPVAVGRARASIEAARSEADTREFEGLVAELRRLHLRVLEYERSVAPAIIDRNDLADLEFLTKEAQGAGVLSRGKKFKALRAALGEAAVTPDNPQLGNAVAQLVPIAREARDAVQRLRTRFPEVPLDGFRIWSAAELDALSGALLRARVAQARLEGYLDPAPEADAAYLAALETAVDVSPRIEECRRQAAAVLPEVEPESWRPWVVGGFDDFRAQVENDRAGAVVRALGPDARSDDARAVTEAAAAFLDAAERLRALDRTFREVVFPDAGRPLRPWLRADVDEIRAAATDAVRLSESLDPPTRVALLATLDDRGTPLLVDVLADAATAWAELGRLLPLTGLDDWLGDRTLLDAVIAEAPLLAADAGAHDNYLELQRWQELRSVVDSLERLGLGGSVPALLDRALSPDEFFTRVQRSGLESILRRRMEQGNLDRFDPKVHERRIDSYVRALDDARGLMRKRIPGLAVARRRAQQLPSGNDVGATQGLLRELRPRRGDKTPIRELVTKYGPVLAEAIPCFLMSPDSVAALLPVGAVDFDLVVFDEASQVRTAHAVGALGRGRAGIVVGDSRQMPPSTTFSANAGAFVAADDDEEDESPGQTDADAVAEGVEPESGSPVPVAMPDAESILSEFDESGLPHRQLLCHYRSKDEVLIAFSNTFIYREPMLTFPAPAGLQSPALRFVHVPDGHFERARGVPKHPIGDGVPALRTNLREAEVILDWLLERLRDPERRARRAADPEHVAESIIVVTFNVPQMDLITEMFRAREPELFDAATKPRVDEQNETEIPPQVKIRNLENVQGDEAETVVFSVAFSKTPDGRFPLRFGPVSQARGERRLNVAVTRAQREMIVFASFLPGDMVSQSGTLSPEVKMIQDFLRLAHDGPNAAGDVGIGVRESHHIEEIAQTLRALGFETETQLGLSTLRVDIALRRPGSDRWEIAVMVDDTEWAERGSAFQREVLPRRQLPAMGWKRVERIWLPAWKHSRDAILDRFGALLDADLDEVPPSSPPEDGPSRGTTEPGADSTGDGGADEAAGAAEFETFVPFSGSPRGGVDVLDSMAFDQRSRAMVDEALRDVLEVEAPIAELRLAKIVAGLFGLDRVREVRSTAILKLVPKTQRTKDSIGTFVWAEQGQWLDWQRFRITRGGAIRTAQEIPAIEYRNALVDFLGRVRELDHETAIKELAAAFGFERVGVNVRDALEQALKQAVKHGVVQIAGGLYRLPDPAS